MNEYIKSSSTHILNTMKSPARMLRYSKARVKNLLYNLYACVCVYCIMCGIKISEGHVLLVNVVIHSHILVHACTCMHVRMYDAKYTIHSSKNKSLIRASFFVLILESMFDLLHLI